MLLGMLQSSARTLQRERSGEPHRLPPHYCEAVINKETKELCDTPIVADEETQKYCGLSTQKGKPFCSKHVECMPYIQNLLKRKQEKEQEEARVERQDRGWTELNPEGSTAQELLNILRQQGSLKLPRLAREANLPEQVVAGYVEVLSGANIFQTEPVARKAKSGDSENMTVLVSATETEFFN